jgi:hypothetical protein
VIVHYKALQPSSLQGSTASGNYPLMVVTALAVGKTPLLVTALKKCCHPRSPFATSCFWSDRSGDKIERISRLSCSFIRPRSDSLLPDCSSRGNRAMSEIWHGFFCRARGPPCSFAFSGACVLIQGTLLVPVDLSIYLSSVPVLLFWQALPLLSTKMHCSHTSNVPVE